MSEFNSLVVFILGVKACGLALTIHLMIQGHTGMWVHYIMRYFVLSAGLFLVMSAMLHQQHFDPNMTAFDIILMCWLWHRSRHGVRES